MLDYFLQRSIKSGIKRNERDHSFLKYTDIKNVLILFNIEEWYELQPIIDDLRQNRKQVTAWTIRPKNTPTFKFPPFVKVIQPEDLTWLNLFKTETTNEFDRLNYDTLLDLTSSHNDHLLWLLTHNKSQFCIGFTERKYKVYDFIFLKEDEQSISEAYEQLKKYLEHIQ